MDQAEQLAETLEALLARIGWTSGTLARRSLVPKATLDNWLRGRAARPRSWQPVIQVATALELDAAETSRLLVAAGHPSVDQLREMHLTAAERRLLEPWAGVKLQSPTSSPTMLPDHRILHEHEQVHLPVTHIPEVSPLPSGSRVHLRRNPYFVGRDQFLLTIARTLGGHEHVHGQSVDTVVLTGIGGIGKTQLATEWVHRYGQHFRGGVFWISFAEPSAIPAAIADAGGHTFLSTIPSFGSLSLDEQVRLVWSSWHDSIPRLLIFDGCEDEALLQQWRPANGNCSVIVTSRRSQWNPLLGVLVLPLHVLERSEAVALLGYYRPDSLHHDEELSAISAELGDLPLALHLAGTFLQRYQHISTPLSYLEQLRSLQQNENGSVLDHPSLHRGAISPTDHVQNVARTFALSYEQLSSVDTVDTLALTLLSHAALFAPGQPIPRELLRASVLPGAGPSDDVYLLEDALARLLNLGLLEVFDDGALCIHRLVAQFINTSRPTIDARARVEEALLTMIAPLNEADDVGALLALQPHIRSITDAALPRNDRATADLCSALGYHLWRINDLQGAEQYLERAFAIREVIDIENPARRAVTHNLLALLRQLQGRFHEARTLFEAALALWESVPNSDASIAIVLNNLGYLLYQLGDYHAAQSLLRRSLVLAHRCFGLCHANTARIISNAAKVHLVQHRSRHAYRLHRLALRIREQLLAPQHLSIAQALNDLGETCLLLGHFDAADRYIERALAMHQALFGVHHHGTAESYYLQGASLYKQQLFDDAAHVLQQAEGIYMGTLGVHHRETARATGLLGMVLFNQGRPAEALAHMKQAISTFHALFGQHHPDVATMLYHLGVYHLSQAHYSDAYTALKQAFDIQRERLGEQHAETQKSLTALTAAVEQGSLEVS